MVYHLLSPTLNARIRLRAEADETTQVPSIIDVFPGADWFEREAYDLYGVIFIGHPDMRRLLTDYGFDGHPLRKDFPLTGFVEVRYDDQESGCCTSRFGSTRSSANSIFSRRGKARTIRCRVMRRRDRRWVDRRMRIESGSALILRSRAQRGVSKDGHKRGAGWFETRSFAALLTMESFGTAPFAIRHSLFARKRRVRHERTEPRPPQFYD